MNRTLILYHLWPLIALHCLPPPALPLGPIHHGAFSGCCRCGWWSPQQRFSFFPANRTLFGSPLGTSEPLQWSHVPAIWSVQAWASRMPGEVCCRDFWEFVPSSKGPQDQGIPLFLWQVEMWGGELELQQPCCDWEEQSAHWAGNWWQCWTAHWTIPGVDLSSLKEIPWGL